MYYWIYQDSERDWRWTLYAANNQRIAECSTGYRNKERCREEIERVKASNSAVVKEGPSELGTKKAAAITGRNERPR
jgi:uncharacterized protein YegP (UPF0339 family)